MSPKKSQESHGDPKSENFKEQLKEISAILEWFDSQEELDIEAALEKIKKAGELIKMSKDKLVQIENEFREIKKATEVDII
jgi:exonuclease VII small subunit